MIVIKLQGGLGNQMFQYALAKSLENISDQRIFFDQSFSQKSTETPRQYALNCFVASNTILAVEMKNLPLIFMHPPGDLLKSIFKSLRLKGFFSANWKYITEKNFQFSIIEDLNNVNIYLDGFWQSEKYFRRNRTKLLSDFSLKNTSSQFETISEQMTSCNSVCLHVRHGDYLSDATTLAFHGVCSPEYYQQALDIIQSKVANPKFYVFTDDLKWTSQHFSKMGLSFQLVSGQGYTDCEELMLMASCKHQIIANSSFSWWGAWLNQNKEKIIIAPKKWFTSHDNYLHELIPDLWIQL